MAIEMKGLCPLIQVFDMPTSLKFYRDTLGFEVVQRSQESDECSWCWLRCGDAELMLNTAYDDDDRPEKPDAARWKGHQDTMLYVGCPDVDDAYEFLKARGVKCEPPKTAWYGMRQLNVTDPDGFGVCFQWKA